MIVLRKKSFSDSDISLDSFNLSNFAAGATLANIMNNPELKEKLKKVLAKNPEAKKEIEARENIQPQTEEINIEEQETPTLSQGGDGMGRELNWTSPEIRFKEK